MFHFPMEPEGGHQLAAFPLTVKPAAGEQRVDNNKAFMLGRQWIVTDTCLITIIVHVVVNSAASGFSFLLENNLCIPL